MSQQSGLNCSSGGDGGGDGGQDGGSSLLFSGGWLVLLVLMMMTLIFLIVLGNALVIWAFKVTKSLRRQSNYYLLNLAVCDFLVGAVCIPLYVPYVLTGRWTLGRGLCKLWLVMDYLLCSASVFSIVLISYDRFLSVTKAVSYRARQTMTQQAVVRMAAVWVLAFVLYAPAIIFWELAVGGSRVPEDECLADFHHSWYFLLSASTLEFFTPFVSVAFFNLSIYLSIRRRRHHGRRGQLRPQVSDPASVSPPRAGRSGMKMAVRGAVHPQTAGSGKVDSCSSSSGMAVPSSRLARDKKIAKSLAIIVCVFAICWAPYTLLMIIRAACRGRCIQHHWYEVTFWLLWLNSAINPFLYPLCHSSFRRAFSQILCPRRHASSTPPPGLRLAK